jgi:hypothetical protein
MKEGESYGTRLAAQLPIVVDELRRDPATRRAVATIRRPQDLAEGKMSYFCTDEIQFLVRGHKLDMHVKMRSNDAWHGLCYNLFQFGQLQCTVASCLDIEVGRYYHTATSMHLYERHWQKTAECRPLGGWYADIHGVGFPGGTWFEARWAARDLLEGGRGKTPAEEWYAAQLEQTFRK